MKVIVQNTAHNSIDSIFEYLSNFSIKNAIETIERIYDCIYHLEKYPFMENIFQKYGIKILDKLFFERLNNLDTELFIIYQKLVIQSI